MLDPVSRIVGVIMIEVGLDILRMVRVAMVAFAIIFPHNLPIRVDGIIDNLCHPGAAKSLRTRHGAEHFLRPSELGWMRRKAEVNQSFDFFDRDLMKTQLRFVEVLLHSAATEQRSFAIIDPLMVRADDSIQCARGLGAKACAPMAANVMQSVNAAIFRSN